MSEKFVITAQDHVMGPENTPVKIIEYTDYQCPYCGDAYYVLNEVLNYMDKKEVRFVFRNFPLVQLHPYALHAAVAAEVAGAQSKFWEMHNLLFENQDKLEDFHLLMYARHLGLNEEQFETDFSDPRFLQKVQKDYDSGIQNKVMGTPTLFINGHIYEGGLKSSDIIEYMQAMV
ncbi:MAG: DsbA family protein [Bacteroides sp.]|nr:DsbA family protein [Bacteroides sp.]